MVVRMEAPFDGSVPYVRGPFEMTMKVAGPMEEQGQKLDVAIDVQNSQVLSQDPVE